LTLNLVERLRQEESFLWKKEWFLGRLARD
jgi:hypothetical protein